MVNALKHSVTPVVWYGGWWMRFLCNVVVLLSNITSANMFRTKKLSFLQEVLRVSVPYFSNHLKHKKHWKLGNRVKLGLLVETSSTQIFLTTPRFPDVGKWNTLLCRNEIHFTLERISRMWAQGHPKQHGNYVSRAPETHFFDSFRPKKKASIEVCAGWNHVRSFRAVLELLFIRPRYSWKSWNCM